MDGVRHEDAGDEQHDLADEDLVQVDERVGALKRVRAADIRAENPCRYGLDERNGRTRSHASEKRAQQVEHEHVGTARRELLLQKADEHSEHCGENGVDCRAAEKHGEARCGEDAPQVERRTIGGLIGAALDALGELLDAWGLLAALLPEFVAGGDDAVVRRSRRDDAPRLREALSVGEVHRDNERRRDSEHVHGARTKGAPDVGKRAFHAAHLGAREQHGFAHVQKLVEYVAVVFHGCHYTRASCATRRFRA